MSTPVCAHCGTTAPGLCCHDCGQPYCNEVCQRASFLAETHVAQCVGAHVALTQVRLEGKRKFDAEEEEEEVGEAEERMDDARAGEEPGDDAMDLDEREARENEETKEAKEAKVPEPVDEVDAAVAEDPALARFRIIIVPSRMCAGFSLSLCEHMLTFPYPSNEAGRKQMRMRLVRVDQRAASVTYTHVVGDILLRMFQRAGAAQSLSDCMALLLAA